jgi:hypothetical protein
MRSTKLSPTQVAYRYSEYGLAYHFAELHQGNLAFIPELTCRMAGIYAMKKLANGSQTKCYAYHGGSVIFAATISILLILTIHPIPKQGCVYAVAAHILPSNF